MFGVATVRILQKTAKKFRNDLDKRFFWCYTIHMKKQTENLDMQKNRFENVFFYAFYFYC